MRVEFEREKGLRGQMCTRLLGVKGLKMRGPKNAPTPMHANRTPIVVAASRICIAGTSENFTYSTSDAPAGDNTWPAQGVPLFFLPPEMCRSAARQLCSCDSRITNVNLPKSPWCPSAAADQWEQANRGDGPVI